MKKFLALAIALCLTTASAQTTRRKKIGMKGRSVTAKLSAQETSTPLPIFLARRGPATITEMMIQPPAFSYGSSINVWILKDKADEMREIAVTGHADSATCRRVSGQVMSLFLEKKKEPEDLFVAGAARMVNRGQTAKKDRLLTEKIVQEYIQAEKELWTAELMVRIIGSSPREGKDDETALEKGRTAAAAAKLRVNELRMSPSVQAYRSENDSAKAISSFVRELREFSSDNGLVDIYEIPFELIEEARARIAKVAASSQGQVVSFEDLLQVAGVREAALFSPVLTVPGGRPVELRIPLASIRTLNFTEAQRNNRDEVEQAIVGNANDRLAVFKQARDRALQNQKRCSNLTPQELDQTVTLPQVCTQEGVCYKTDKPTKITMREYCTVQVPLNLRIVNEWIDSTKELLKKIDEDVERKDGSRISEINYATLVDSMLRDWRLPVSRSQGAFDKWRGSARGPVWRLINAQLSRMGLAPDVIGGEQMIFSVKVENQILIVRPIHVIDMARSVLVVDPTSGATRVLDAWSMRSQTTAKAESNDPSSPVQRLVNDSIKLLAAGDRAGAEAQIVAAFSHDPATAFHSVQREWLQQFPDTRQRMLAIQESLKPIPVSLGM